MIPFTRKFSIVQYNTFSRIVQYIKETSKENLYLKLKLNLNIRENSSVNHNFLKVIIHEDSPYLFNLILKPSITYYIRKTKLKKLIITFFKNK